MLPAVMPSASCLPFPTPGCVLGKIPGAIVSSGFESMASSFADGYIQMLKMVTTFWVKIDVGALSSDPNGVIVLLRDLTWWWLLVIACVGAMIGAAKLAVNQDAREGQLILKGLLRTVLVAGGGVAVINLLSISSDKTAAWIIEKAMADHADQGFSFFGGGSALHALPPGILFIVAFFGIIASLAQLMLLVFRAAFVTVMAGILPLAAASSVTSSGVEWFNRLAGYTLAAIMYKPVAALIYAAAFKLMDSSGALGVLQGLALVILAILALPSMMRLLVPAMGAASSGASGMFGAGIGAATVAAQGATVLTGNVGGGSGGSGSSSPSAPQGASMTEGGTKALSSGAGETAAAAGTSGSASAAGAARAGGGAAAAGSGAAAGATGGTSLAVTESVKAVASTAQAVQQGAKDLTGDEQ